MTWNETKAINDLWGHTDYNDMVDCIMRISGNSVWVSGNYVSHSSNSTIHYPSSSLENWFDNKYAPHSWMDNSGSKYSNAYSSGQVAMYTIEQSDNIDSWNSSRWHNSSLIWDNSSKLWKAMKSSSGTGGGASNLSQLTIDTNKVTLKKFLPLSKPHL